MRLSFALRGTWDDPPNLALGAIAQLEERLDRTQEVAGSSPASSIAWLLAQGGEQAPLAL